MKKKYLKSFPGRLVLTGFFALLQIVTFIVMLELLSSYAFVINLTLSVISVIAVIAIVNRPYNPAYKLTWSILILSFPVFGGLMYLVSRLQTKTHSLKKKAVRSSKLLLPYRKQDPSVLAAISAQPLVASSTAAYLSVKQHYPIYAGGEAAYLPGGEVYFEQLKTELSRATKFIFLEFFIIQEGIMWDSLLKILIAKVKEGVDVRLIYDGMGCMSPLPPKYDRVLSSLGIKVMVFSPFIPLATIIQNNRDHRKIVVIDGHTAFTGGVNLADEYINAYARFGHWRDSGILFRGEAVNSFTLTFLETWYMNNPVDEKIDDFLYRPSANGFVPANFSSCFLQPYADSPLNSEPLAEQVYFNLINKAKRYVYIATPYLIPDSELLTALTCAAKCGVDVRILTPHIPDKWYVFDVTRSYYRELIKAGVSVYEYTPGFVHSKLVIVDDTVAAIGSINLDYRSLYLHFECGTLVYHPDTVINTKNDFLSALSVSERITPAIDHKIRRKRGLIMSLLRLVAPLF